MAIPGSAPHCVSTQRLCTGPECHAFGCSSSFATWWSPRSWGCSRRAPQPYRLTHPLTHTSPSHSPSANTRTHRQPANPPAHPDACCPSHRQAALWKVEGLFLAQLHTASLRSGFAQAQSAKTFNWSSLATWWSPHVVRGPCQFGDLAIAKRRPNATLRSSLLPLALPNHPRHATPPWSSLTTWWSRQSLEALPTPTSTPTRPIQRFG